MARTVLPCAGDLSRTARNPGVSEVPHQGRAQGTGPAPLSELQGALSDRRRDPSDADRGSETGARWWLKPLTLTPSPMGGGNGHAAQEYLLVSVGDGCDWASLMSLAISPLVSA